MNWTEPAGSSETGCDRFGAFLAEIKANYVERRPESRRAHQAASRFLPGGNTRSVLFSRPFPIRFVAAAGSQLTDADGHTYVDLLGNYSAGLFGASPLFVQTTIERVLDTGWGYGGLNTYEAEFAQLVCHRYRSIDKVRFTNSGTEANLMALAAARRYTHRPAVLVFGEGYHGSALNFSEHGSGSFVPGDWIVCSYNDLDSVERAFDDRGRQVAAAIVEPMLGAGGCIPAHPDFLSGLRALCDSYDVLLVLDEVMTSRLSWGGAQEIYGTTPDLTTLGKYLAGGLSIGAFGGSAEIMDLFDGTGGLGISHGGTFNNNVLSMAAGVSSLRDGPGADELRDLNSRGDRLRVSLNEVFARADVEMCATGMGSLLTIHGMRGPIHRPLDRRRANTRIPEALHLFLADFGFYIAPRGYLALSFAVDDSQIADFLDTMREFVERLKWLSAESSSE